MLRLLKTGKALRIRGPIGTFSYYHPKHLFTGFGWDAQSASLALVKHSIKTILLLGLGGGTVARQCRALFPNAQIEGVEIEKSVLGMAYESFGIAALNIRTFNTSGQDYLQTTDRKFDAIIDDMWMPNAGSSKPVLTEPNWDKLVKSRLNHGGVYAVNLYSQEGDPYEVAAAIKRLKSRFCTFYEIRPRLGQTTVIATGSRLHTPKEARIRLRHLAKSQFDELRAIRFLLINEIQKGVSNAAHSSYF